MPLDATTNVGDWDFHNFHVQEELTGGEFINAESTLVCAGPPSLAIMATLAGTPVYPIGLVENAGISQSKQLQRVFEIGSSRSYFIPGRVVGSLSMGRVIFNGHSLLRVKYAWMDLDGALFDDSIEADILDLMPHDEVIDNPTSGYAGAVFNLNSSIFNQPYGLTLIMKDQIETSWAQVYLENCYVQGHQFSVSSGSSLLLEAATSQFDRLMPISVA
jgi:hypothetical protein